MTPKGVEFLVISSPSTQGSDESRSGPSASSGSEVSAVIGKYMPARWPWVTRNTWVVGHWALLLLVTAVVWCLTALFMTAGIPRSIDGTVMLFALLALSVTLFYPNRAITAFLSCPNVQSATLTGWNKDTTLEEFQITVTWSDRAGRTISHGIPFNQYPTRQDIAEKVATVGCRS